MVLIQAGDFWMGSETGNDDEKPVHRVSLDAFYIDKYEVTNAQFAVFLNAKGNQVEGSVPWLEENDWVNVLQIGGTWQAREGFADHPVIWVSWYGAQAYCTWRGVRLPTEAEWEKAARGGLEGTLYPWGDELAVCDKDAPNSAQFGDCEGDTAPVGSFTPNGYGLYDMAGNAWEWVYDWHDEDQTYFRNSPSHDPTGPESGIYRVLRGGAWDTSPESLQVSSRNRAAPDMHLDLIGFRCADNQD